MLASNVMSYHVFVLFNYLKEFSLRLINNLLNCYFSNANFGSAVEVQGVLEKSKHADQKVELKATKLDVVGGCDVDVKLNSISNYIQPCKNSYKTGISNQSEAKAKFRIHQNLPTSEVQN